jgi:signal peptidase II
MQPRTGIFFSVLALFFAIASDLVSKHLFFGTSKNTSEGFFSFIIQRTSHQNYGMSFNIAFPSFLLIGLSILILGGLLIFFTHQAKKGSWNNALALSLLFGGAVGNLFDRITLGYVRDWILLFERSAINLADLWIIVGALGYIWLHRSTALQLKEKVIPRN